MKKLKKLSSKLKHPLVKKNPVKALMLLGKLNLVNKLFPSGIILTVFDRVKYLSRKGSSLNRNYWMKLADHEEFSFLQAVLKSTDGFIDIGANVGEYALFSHAFADCKVYAFEPNYQTYCELCINIGVNNFSKIQPYNLALAEKPGRLYLTNTYGTANRIVQDEERLASKNQNLIEIEVGVLDDKTFNEDRLFMKIDVEGYEQFVLAGAQNLLADKRLKAILIELNGSGKKFGVEDNDIHQMLCNKGFIPAKYNVSRKVLEPQPSYNKDGFNTIYFRKDTVLFS